MINSKRGPSDKWEIYVNPDGSKGGLVSKFATIGAGVFVHPFSVVMAVVNIKPDTVIGPHVVVRPEGIKPYMNYKPAM